MNTTEKSYLTTKHAKKFLLPVIVIVLLFSLCMLTSCSVVVGGLLLSGSSKSDFRKLFAQYNAKEWCEIASDGSYMELDTNPYDYDYDNSSFTLWSIANLDDVMDAISEANKILDFSESLLKKMRNTTALQGRQTEENEKYRVTWSYHPDNGLEVLYEIKK